MNHVTAVALVALMAAVSLGPVLHAGVGHDTDCDPVVVVHDESQHRFAAPNIDPDVLPAAEHCVVCHLFRGSRNSETAWNEGGRDLQVALVARLADNSLVGAQTAAPLPARAPPTRS